MLNPSLLSLLLALATVRNPSVAPGDGMPSRSSQTWGEPVATGIEPLRPLTDTTTSSSLTCTPQVMRPGDTLILRMETPHGEYLTANHPDGTLFFIVYPQFDVPTRKFSLLPSRRFKTVRTLGLPANLRANPRVYGRDTTVETLFSRSGEYVLWVGDNLESDYNSRSVSCRVTFVAEKK